MKFLKFVVAVMTMALLYFFIGNVLQYIFPAGSALEEARKAASTYQDCYSRDYPQRSAYGTEEEYQKAVDARQAEQDACTKKADEEREAKQLVAAEEGAQQYLNGLYRGMVILFVLVGIAIAIFRRYPYLASALVLVGVAFVGFYPFTVTWGDVLGELMSGGQESATLRQIQLIKTLLQGVGVAALIAADVLFFEKEKAADSHESWKS